MPISGELLHLSSGHVRQPAFDITHSAHAGTAAMDPRLASCGGLTHSAGSDVLS